MSGSRKSSAPGKTRRGPAAHPIACKSGYSIITARIIRQLDAAYPHASDLSGCPDRLLREDKFDDVWRLLKSQHMVTGQLSNCSLTLPGRRAYHSALAGSSDLIKFKLRTHKTLQDHEANQPVVDTLREQFRGHLRRLKRL